MKDELLLCLAELNDVEPSEMENESKDWMERVDRGGLMHISNMTYMMFASAEKFHKHIMVRKTQSVASLSFSMYMISEHQDEATM